MRVLAAPLLLIAALPATAEPVAAPGYFVDAAFLTSTAQVLALNCDALSIEPVAMARLTEDAMTRLTEDGFTPENLATRMADPTAAIADRQTEFTTTHGLVDGAPEAAVCAAGRAEIAGSTPLGKLLLEVQP